jgi:arginyl-tRNA synthetase
MAGLLATLALALRPAFDAIEPGADPVLRPSGQPGVDAQANGALGLAKRVGLPPAEVAARVVAAADLDGICSAVEISPQGFINLTASDRWLAAAVLSVAADSRSGRSRAERPERIVVDYSAPNVAKELHVGHLRSTIIGDALCRLLADAGHEVRRENHLGDWGTPFGMLLELLADEGQTAETLSIGDLNEFYRRARARFDSSEEFRDRARRRVVALQSGDATTLALWKALVDDSIRYFDRLYARLDVLLRPEDVVGESAYNDQLPEVVAELDRLGLLVESDGARCVFPAGFTNRDGDPLPLIVQKSDGGFGYAASDLAAVRDRFGRQGANRVLYVVGAPQAQHLAMVFAVAHEAGWLPEPERAVHVAFGNMLGSDHRMFRTRDGETVRLRDLLDEAVERAAGRVAQTSPDLDDDDRHLVAHAVGVGALKYADLANDRVKDYVFDWDRMLAMEGNTAPYLQYAHARIHSILRRGGVDPGDAAAIGHLDLAEPAERDLALDLLGLDTAVAGALDGYSPHKLCTYLYELAGTFTRFYETCPVLRAPDPSVRESRLLLCAVTASVISSGLDLLGIRAPTRM